nr:MAG TPA: hypothetical protein [Caudoviricetes sp.]
MLAIGKWSAMIGLQACKPVHKITKDKKLQNK